jgi:hypothetical protein
LLITASVVGLATIASAATLNVYTTDTANVLKSTFVVGETFLLKVTGDSQGGTDRIAFGHAYWNAALTTTVDIPSGCVGSFLYPCTSAVQGDWFGIKGTMIKSTIIDPAPFDGNAYLLNQLGDRTAVQVDTSFITLVADASGVTDVRWRDSQLEFFGIYVYSSSGSINIPTGHSFTIVPEPASAALIALALLGLAGWRRGRA